MGIIAGFDLGNGSQTKLIRTNFLVTNLSGAADSQALSNMLNLANNRLPTMMKCDYIYVGIGTVNVPTGAPANSTEHSNVALSANQNNIALMGPSTASLAARAGIGSHGGEGGVANSVQIKASGKVIMLTGIGVVKIQASAATDNFDVFSAVELPGQTLDESQLDEANGLLLVKQLTTGASATVDLQRPLFAARNGISNVNYHSSELAAGSFVPEGNREGTPPTTFTSLGADIDNKFFGILSVTALVETAR